MISLSRALHNFGGSITNDPTSGPPTATGGGRGGSLNLPEVAATDAQIRNLLSIAFGVIGAVALIYVILGGISYIYSSGEPQKAKQAKETIIYALIGLVIAVSAEIIVWTVLSRV